MTLWKATTPLQTKRKCLRCGRDFIPKKAGENYGPKCARKLAGQVELDSMSLISGRVLKA